MVKELAEEKLHAKRDAQICYLRKRFRWPHSRLAVRFKLTTSRIAQILKEGNSQGIRSPYVRPKKTKLQPKAHEEPSDSCDSPQEEAALRRWARSCRFLSS